MGSGFTAEELLELRDTVDELVRRIDDDARVPERYQSSLAGELAESDSAALTRASAVVFRLMLAETYPNVEHGTYFTGEPAEDEEELASVPDGAVIECPGCGRRILYDATTEADGRAWRNADDGQWHTCSSAVGRAGLELEQEPAGAEPEA